MRMVDVVDERTRLKEKYFKFAERYLDLSEDRNEMELFIAEVCDNEKSSDSSGSDEDEADFLKLE